MDDLRERMMRAADAADQAALPGFPTGPMSEGWMNAFLAAIEQEGLRVVVADETASSSPWEFLRQKAARWIATPFWNLRFGLGMWIGGFTEARRNYE